MSFVSRKLLMSFFFSSPIRTKGIWAEKNEDKLKKKLEKQALKHLLSNWQCL